MSLQPTRKRKIDAAIDSSAQPYRSKANNLLLRLGEKSYATLQGSSGGLTGAGRYYYEKSGQAQPDEFDGGTLQQRGATDYLVRAGKARVLRRFQGGEYTYTALGKRYFREHTTSYLVNVPGIIKKARRTEQGRPADGPSHSVHDPRAAHGQGNDDAPTTRTVLEEASFGTHRNEPGPRRARHHSL